MGNIEQKNSQPCCGCGGCAAVCPQDAVQLELDEAGFYRARVDRGRCVDCGLCMKVCARFSLRDGGVSLYDCALYALQSADADTVRCCSSGGIAHELAVQAINSGGMAAGVVYDFCTDTVCHEIVSDIHALRRLDGSKYLQSRTDSAFREILAAAAHTPCTVFGTPCQISALAAAAQERRVRDNLLLVEIFCHGVPSYRLWDDTLKRIRKKLGGGPFDSVQFRYKKDDWHSYCLRVDAGGRTWYGKRETELFWQVYFENVLLGDSCQVCTARQAGSLADLRLGDYWGPRFRRRSDGVSAVFTCTDKGREAVEQLLAAGKAVQLISSDPQEMLAAQNMEGYRQQQLHAAAMTILRTRGLRKAVACYRRRQTLGQKLKRALLTASGVLPDGLRAGLRKAYSSRMLKKL